MDVDESPMPPTWPVSGPDCATPLLVDAPVVTDVDVDDIADDGVPAVALPEPAAAEAVDGVDDAECAPPEAAVADANDNPDGLFWCGMATGSGGNEAAIRSKAFRVAAALDTDADVFWPTAACLPLPPWWW